VVSYLIAPASGVSAGASGAIFGVMGAYVVLARLRGKPLGPVLALIVINLVLGFTGNIEWQAHVGGLVVGGLLALAFHYAWTLRRTAQEVAATVGASALTLGVLAVLLLAIAPGHVNVS
jgi:membrane associated rhomboid family serine protease